MLELIKSKRTRKIYVLSIIIISILFGLSIFITPNAKERNAELSDFSAIRAKDHLLHIAQKPHPVGSQEHDEVRDYLFKQLTNLGLMPEIQKGNYAAETGEKSKAEILLQG